MAWKYEFVVPENKKVRVIIHTDCKNESDHQFAFLCVPGKWVSICLKIVEGLDGVFAWGHSDQLMENSSEIAGRREYEKPADIGRLFIVCRAWH